MAKQAIIIGAGPAGLTAAYELLTRTEIIPIVVEKSPHIGGISRTANYKGNRMDIGGHRFFSKSDRVMEWWFQHMPIEAGHDELNITYQQQSRQVRGNGDRPSADQVDEVMLVRQRRSRIYFLRRFFDYPIKLTGDTLGKLGLARSTKIGFSYIGTRLSPIKDEKNLEEFFINRFGRELYGTFFKSYTEKVWGVPCDQISAEWGAQRIKGLSITKAIAHFFRQAFSSKKSIAQKETETSLIEQFLYPKLGPGQMWELVAEKVRSLGGTIVMQADVIKLHTEGARVTGVSVLDSEDYLQRFDGDYFFSTMPVQELIGKLDCPVPPNVRQVSDGLQYRDFITVGLLVDKLRVSDRSGRPIDDNWIYVQEPDVLVGRLQIFNNWSPYLVGDKTKTWIGAEYFCYEGDELWKKSDEDMLKFCAAELEKIGILDANSVLDGTVIHVPKTYPAYFGSYDRFNEIREWIDRFENLYLVGRNGMHKYNNQDHSMLTAMTAVDNIITGRKDKENIWAVNTEMEYHESK
ncbi:MAG TPA: NAD(P)/FAD-dependent oxidoreductase [Candidatus Koribacter sp.]|jgi:protoporphyrinogen oxidase